jgi:hypothetical protein
MRNHDGFISLAPRWLFEVVATGFAGLPLKKDFCGNAMS